MGKKKNTRYHRCDFMVELQDGEKGDFKSIQIPEDLSEWVKKLQKWSEDGGPALLVSNLSPQSGVVTVELTECGAPNTVACLETGDSFGLYLDPDEALALGRALIFAAKSLQ